MKYFLSIFFLLPLMTIGQINQVFKVKLIDFTNDKMPPPCGKIAAATTLKFQLSEQIDSLKKGQEILVIFSCPSDLGIKFINNQEYLLTLCNPKETKEKTQYSWSMWYKYENKKLSKFWCKEIEKIK